MLKFINKYRKKGRVALNSNREKRLYKLGKSDQRDPFPRDRDRILYSSAFKRLAGVTQIVSPEEGVIFHNRLTHSLKVAQVARRTAEQLIKTHEKNPN